MRFKLILSILFLILLVWIDMPENHKIQFSIGGKKFQYTLNPPRINTNLYGLQIRKEFTTKLGLDLKGGSHLVFEADTSKVPASDLQDALNSSKDIIERRVNFFGVSEPSVQTLKTGNKYRIAVDLPGVTDTTESVQLIGQTANLEFTEAASSEAKIATDTPQVFNLTKPTGLTGKDIKKANVVFDPQTGAPQVQLNFSSEGVKKFADITGRNVGKQVGILIDGFPVSAPVVNQPITDGNAVIQGNFTVDTAKQLAVAINSGALPLPIRLVEQRSIGATLGEREVKKSVTAGVIGLTMVMLFMILYYGRLGVIACMGLIVYGLLSFAVFRAIPIVLTLPGIAGFLLSIGMAVDTNILIFERIKEERRKGRDFDIAVRLGFGKAIDAIKDANITTLIVAFILFNPLNWEFLPQFGLVRGFALTLAIGVLMSLFTGLFVTRRLIKIFYRE